MYVHWNIISGPIYNDIITIIKKNVYSNCVHICCVLWHSQLCRFFSCKKNKKRLLLVSVVLMAFNLNAHTVCNCFSFTSNFFIFFIITFRWSRVKEYACLFGYDLCTILFISYYVPYFVLLLYEVIFFYFSLKKHANWKKSGITFDGISEEE